MAWYDYFNPVYDYKKISHAVDKAKQAAKDELVDLIDPDLDDMRAEYSRLNRRYQTMRIDVLDRTEAYTKALADYKGYAAMDAGLMIGATVLELSDEEFKEYLATTLKSPPGLKQENVLPIGVAKLVDWATGHTTHVTNAIYSLERLRSQKGFSDASAKVFGGAQALQETGGIERGPDLQAVEDMMLEVLDVDSVFDNLPFGVRDLIGVAEEHSALESALPKMRRAVADLNAKLHRIETCEASLKQSVKDRRRHFIELMRTLDGIMPARFAWRLTDADSESDWKASMVDALQQYGSIHMIRERWHRYQANSKSKQPGQDFVKYMLLVHDRSHCTAAQLKDFIKLVAKHTPSLAKAMEHHEPPAPTVDEQLEAIKDRYPNREAAMVAAYDSGRFTIGEIADHFGVLYRQVLTAIQASNG